MLCLSCFIQMATLWKPLILPFSGRHLRKLSDKLRPRNWKWRWEKDYLEDDGFKGGIRCPRQMEISSNWTGSMIWTRACCFTIPHSSVPSRTSSQLLSVGLAFTIRCTMSIDSTQLAPRHDISRKFPVHAKPTTHTHFRPLFTPRCTTLGPHIAISPHSSLPRTKKIGYSHEGPTRRWQYGWVSISVWPFRWPPHSFDPAAPLTFACPPVSDVNSDVDGPVVDTKGKARFSPAKTTTAVDNCARSFLSAVSNAVVSNELRQPCILYTDLQHIDVPSVQPDRDMEDSHSASESCPSKGKEKASFSILLPFSFPIINLHHIPLAQ